MSFQKIWYLDMSYCSLYLRSFALWSNICFILHIYCFVIFFFYLNIHVSFSYLKKVILVFKRTGHHSFQPVFVMQFITMILQYTRFSNYCLKTTSRPSVSFICNLNLIIFIGLLCLYTLQDSRVTEGTSSQGWFLPQKATKSKKGPS